MARAENVPALLHALKFGPLGQVSINWLCLPQQAL
jgi:hypothetical protein